MNTYDKNIFNNTENQETFYRPDTFSKKLNKKIKKIGESFKNYFKGFWKKLIILGLILLCVLVITIIVISSQVNVLPRKPYNKDNFINAQTPEKENYFEETNNLQTILENENYKFELDNTTTHFTLTDKKTNAVWVSNPNSSFEKHLSPIKACYYYSVSENRILSAYEDAISYNTYMLRILDDSVEVLYNLGGKKNYDYYDFPQIITRERMETLILSKLDPDSSEYNRIIKVFVEDTVGGQDVYILKKFPNQRIIDQVHEIIFDTCGYTEDDLKIDSEMFGYENEEVYPYLEVAIKYTLKNDALEVKVINDSILEQEEYPLLYIDVLPMFGCATTDDTGYALIPDGSGVVIDFNNTRAFTTKYEQRIYGNDLTKINEVNPDLTEKIMLPMYGIKKNEFGFIHVCEESASQTNIYSETYKKGASDFNYAFYRTYYREGEKYEFTSLQSKTKVTEWTKEYVKNDFTSVIMSTKNTGTYYDMASTYKDYLISTGKMPNENPNKVLSFDLSLLGGYLEDRNFIGFKYQKVQSLTNTKEAEEIIQTLLDSGITDINVVYRGWTNDGLEPTYMGSLDTNSVTGTKRKLRTLQEFCNEASINLYPEVYLYKAYTEDGFNEDKLATQNIFGKVVQNRSYYDSTYVRNVNTRDYYYLKPETLEDSLNKISKYFRSLTFSNIYFADLGQGVYGTYKKGEVTFRSETEKLINECLEANTMKTMFSNSYDFTFKYASNIINAPITGTNYQIVGYSVPFYQLVLNGNIPYSNESFNLYDKYDYSYHKLKAMETLGNVNFTWSYKDTLALIDTTYNNYYATNYKAKYDEVVNLYKELKELGLYKLVITNHETLTPDGLITKTTYSNGLEIIYNFGQVSKDILGVTIPGLDYKVIKEGM